MPNLNGDCKGCNISDTQGQMRCICKHRYTCIDPCDNCPNMLAVQFDEKDEVIESTLCPYEQGSVDCCRVQCSVCKEFELISG